MITRQFTQLTPTWPDGQLLRHKWLQMPSSYWGWWRCYWCYWWWWRWWWRRWSRSQSRNRSCSDFWVSSYFAPPLRWQTGCVIKVAAPSMSLPGIAELLRFSRPPPLIWPKILIASSTPFRSGDNSGLACQHFLCAEATEKSGHLQIRNLTGTPNTWAPENLIWEPGILKCAPGNLKRASGNLKWAPENLRWAPGNLKWAPGNLKCAPGNLNLCTWTADNFTRAHGQLDTGQPKPKRDTCIILHPLPRSINHHLYPCFVLKQELFTLPWVFDNWLW